MRWVGVLVAVAVFAYARSSDACGIGAPVTARGLPETGATDIPTGTSILVLGSGVEPRGPLLSANGVDVPIDGFELVGYGTDGTDSRNVGFWRVRGPEVLEPETEYVLTISSDGTRKEMTRFTTGAALDVAPGSAPVVRSLGLWRVQYPISDIQSGNCVFNDHHSFISVDYSPGTVPGTPEVSMVHTILLKVTSGGEVTRLVTMGPTLYKGGAPEGDYPIPDVRWYFDVDPTREYCVQVISAGYGPQRLASNEVCAPVTELTASTGEAEEGGCSLGGGADGAWLVLLALTRARRDPRRPGRRRCTS